MGCEIKQKYFFLFFSLTFIFCLSVSAIESMPTAKFRAGSEGSELKPVDWSFQINKIWKENSEGGVEFFWALQLQIPGQIGISNIQAQKSEIGVRQEKPGSTNEQTIFIGLRSVNDRLLVTMKDNSHLEIDIQLLFQTPIIIDEGCEELNLKLVQTSKAENYQQTNDGSALRNIPFYMAYKCDPIASGIRLSVTAPLEMSWFSNSFFETKGKGKNWKNFELGMQLNNYNKQDVGIIEFEWNNIHFPFQIYVEKTEIIRPISTFVFSSGLMSVNIDNSVTSQSLAKPIASVAFELRPLNPNLSLGGIVKTSIPSADPDNYFSHTETRGFLGYTVLFKKNWYLEPRGYFYLTNGVIKAMNFFYVSSNFALGGILRYEASKRNLFSFETLFTSLNSQSLFSAQFAFTRKNKNQVGGWGLILDYEMFGVNLNSSDESSANMTYFGPFIEF
jgi:hypothetical protein